MQRIIRYAVLALALLVSTGDLLAQAHRVPRPGVTFIVLHRYHPPCLFPFVVPDPTLPPAPYSASTYAGQDFVTTSPAYIFVGSNSPARPQLVFKDGTTYTVSDYWRVDDQLHFVTVEEGGTKSVARSVAFDTLDVDRTKDTATKQGFRFVIRDKPIEQWLEHRDRHAPSRTRTNRKG